MQAKTCIQKLIILMILMLTVGFHLLSVNAALSRSTLSRDIKKIDDLFAKTTLNRKKILAKPIQKARPFTIVIDAGHGGFDPGARGKFGRDEKHVVLSIAKKLAQAINRHSNMRAVLTRDGDYFVPLRKRLNLARKGNADLFIAIHADAYFNTSAEGASVYALSPHGASNEAARWLSKRDNYSELGNVELNKLQDRSLELRALLIDLAQTETIKDSLRLGQAILKALNKVSSLHIKQVGVAPFVVLKSPDIPSILVETGFMTHPREAARLANPLYQQKMALALWLGIQQYLKHSKSSATNK